MLAFEREITRASDDKRFHEEVTFEVKFLDKKMKPHTFDGDFIEALIWINKSWENWYKEDDK